MNSSVTVYLLLRNTVIMCHKIHKIDSDYLDSGSDTDSNDHSIYCWLCERAKAEPYCACVDEEKDRAYDCNNILGYDVGDTRERIFTKCDKATDITYLCGWCVVYISRGHNEENLDLPSKAQIDKQCASRRSTTDHMAYLAREKALDIAEDGAMCGYKDKDGATVVIVCWYELAGDENTTVKYVKTFGEPNSH